jgi:lysophospholipase L1-like esterase
MFYRDFHSQNTLCEGTIQSAFNPNGQKQGIYVQQHAESPNLKRMAFIKFVILSMFLFSGCTMDSDVESRNTATAPGPDPETSSGLSYLALGDSYTIGQNVTTDQRWPVLLVKDLKAAGKSVRKPDIIAVTGWTTANLLSSLNSQTLRKDYDLVSLMIGVNNQYQGQGPDQYRREFRELLLKSIEYAGGNSNRVFVLSIPDWGVTPYGGSVIGPISKEIDHFNSVGKQECDKLNVLFTDITPTSRLALNNPEMVASDRLHFSGKMHQLWVNQVIGDVTEILTSKK